MIWIRYFLLVSLFTCTTAISQAKSKKCKVAFSKNQMGLFVQPSKPATPPPTTSKKTTKTSSKNTQPSGQKLGKFAEYLGKKKPRTPAPKKPTRAQIKKEASYQLQDALSRNDLQALQDLIIEHPHLKTRNVRFTQGPLVDRIPSKFSAWSPRGWGILQLAMFFRKLDAVDLLLDLQVNAKTLKIKGSQSVESNLLHTAIRMNYLEGVRLVVKKYRAFREYSRIKGHFIDEKDLYKQTPWALAVRLKNLDIIQEVANGLPSGEVEFPYRNARTKQVSMVDGLERALITRDREIISIARKYLRLSKTYQENIRLKNEYPDSRTQMP